jgi:O-antigen/teichoic acid export membrane protein
MSRVLLSIGVIQVVIMLVALVRAKVLSVLLGPAGYGVASTIDQTVLSTMQLAHLSLPFTAMKFMARRHSDGQEAFERTYATFFRALTLLALVAVAVVAALLLWKPGLFGSDLIAYRPVLFVAILGVPAAMLNILFVNTLASAQRGASSAMVNMYVLAALALAAIVGVQVHGIAGLYVATALAGLFTTGGSIWYLRRTLGVRVNAPTNGLVRELRASPEIVSYALLIYAAMSAYSLTMLAIRYFAFNQLGATAAGLLQAALGIALTAGAVVTPMNGFFLTPYLNRQLPLEEKARAANDFAGKVLALFVVGGVVVALFPGLVVSLLFSPRFTAVAGVLFLFVIWQCLYQFVNVYLQLLIGLDDVAFFSVSTFFAYGVTALFFRPLIAEFAIAGVALALSLTMLVLLLAMLLRLRFRFGVSIDSRVWARTAFAIAVIAGAGAAGRIAPELSLPGFSIRLLYAGLAVTAMAFLLDPSERMLLVDLARRLRPRRARTIAG